MHSIGIEVELHIPSFDEAKAFYGSLGFNVVWERSAQEKSGYLVLELEDNIIKFWPGNEFVLKQSYFSQFSSDTKRGFGVELILQTHDLDEIYSAAERLDCVVDKLRLRPWGLRDFRAEDPFGYYLRFTEPHDIKSLSYGGR